MPLRIFDREVARKLLRRKPLDELPVGTAMRARTLATFDANSVRSDEAECYHRFET